MSRAWLSAHGAAAVKCKETTFSITTDDGGSFVRPTSTSASELKGPVLFPLPNFPPNAAYLSDLAIDFSTSAAWVEEVVVLYGGDELYKKKRMGRTSDLSIKIPPSEDVKIYSDDTLKSLALTIHVKFEDLHSSLTFRCVGVGVSLPPASSGVKVDSGTWNTMDVRDWEDSTTEAKERINFKSEFATVPIVTAGMTGADVCKEENFRVKVYVDGVDTKGFTIHADTWGGTHLYSAGVSWIALGT